MIHFRFHMYIKLYKKQINHGGYVFVGSSIVEIVLAWKHGLDRNLVPKGQVKGQADFGDKKKIVVHFGRNRTNVPCT